MNKQTELLVPIVYSDQGKKHFLFVIDESKFCLNALGDQRTVFFFFSSGPRAYAPDAPQPSDIVQPPSSSKRSHFFRQSAFSSVLPERPLAAKCGTTWARNMADNFA